MPKEVKEIIFTSYVYEYPLDVFSPSASFPPLQVKPSFPSFPAHTPDDDPF